MQEPTLYAPREDQVVVAAAPELRLDPRFVQHMLGWYRGLEPMPLEQAFPNPSHGVIFATDLIVGFAYEGPLSGPRVAALVPRAADLFHRAYAHGVRHFILTQDTHSPDTPEFEAWGRHCVRGTPESQTVAALAELPFSDDFTIIEKNSLNQAIATNLDGWLAERPALSDFVVIGDCTDLCVYQAAMHLRMHANALNIQGRRVIVPADQVDTFDFPLDAAMRVGALAHPGDFFHLVFLYHMAVNGIQIVRTLV